MREVPSLLELALEGHVDVLHVHELPLHEVVRLADVLVDVELRVVLLVALRLLPLPLGAAAHLEALV